jgi:hypothetical protein
LFIRQRPQLLERIVVDVLAVHVEARLELRLAEDVVVVDIQRVEKRLSASPAVHR